MNTTNTLKQGREITTKVSDLFRTSYGTVDVSTLKSIFLNLSTWVEPTEELDNWERSVNKFKSNIKSTVHNELSSPFKEIAIIDLDLRSSGIKVGKRSFMRCEVTLFLDKDSDSDIKSKDISEPVNKITNKIIYNSLMTSNTYKFHKSKK
jgi:hypothetical protein